MRFMLADILEGATGLLLSPIVFLLPGYALGRLTGVLDFCSRSLRQQVAIALVLSLAVGPVLLHVLLRVGWGAVWIVYGVAAVVALVYFVRSTSVPGNVSGSAAIGVGTAAVLLLLVVDIGWGDRLYFSVVARDYLKHFALTEVIRGAGTPPSNPFFLAGEQGTLFYYYGWLQMTAALDSLGGGLVGPRGGVLAGTAAVGLGLMALASVYARTLDNPLAGVGRGGRAAPILAAVLLAVGGLDVLVFLLGMAGQAALGIPIVFTDIEWWNEPLFLWITSVLTVPHHVAGFICALVGLRVARWAVDPVGGTRAAGVIVSGLAFASTAICSVWIAVGTAMVAGTWMVSNALRRQWREVGVFAAAGSVGLLAALPYLLELVEAGSGKGSPLSIGLRYFGPFNRYLDIGRTGFESLLHLVALPFAYAAELGFVAMGGFVFWRARRRRPAPPTQDERLMRVVLQVGLTAPIFLYSSIRMNDFGFRVPMFAQFVLLIWSAFALDGLRLGSLTISRRTKRALVALMVVGVCSTVVQALVLRFVPPAADVGLIAMPAMHAEDRNLGARTFAHRQAYEWLQAQTTPQDIVQHNPKQYAGSTRSALAFYPALYARRPFAAYDYDMSTLFAVPFERYEPVAAEITSAFTDPSAGAASQVSARYDLEALVVDDRDPVWANSNSWVWRQSPDFSNAYVRVFLNPSERF